MPIRLTQAATKAYREAKLREQGGRCALTGYTISAAEAVLDHCHSTGHVRGVLHRGANSLLGKIVAKIHNSIPLVRDEADRPETPTYAPPATTAHTPAAPDTTAPTDSEETAPTPPPAENQADKPDEPAGVSISALERRLDLLKPYGMKP